MTDIVEQLRQHEWGGTKPSIFSDAAAEIEKLRARLVGVEALLVDQHGQIERLRAALRGLLMLFDTNKHPPARELVEAARAALNERP
jgi:hypothetical protein